VCVSLRLEHLRGVSDHGKYMLIDKADLSVGRRDSVEGRRDVDPPLERDGGYQMFSGFGMLNAPVG